MSKVAWDKLSPADQALVKKTAREAQLEQRAALGRRRGRLAAAKLKAEGVEFIAMDNKAFFDATAPVRAKYGAQFTALMAAHRRRSSDMPWNADAHRMNACAGHVSTSPASGLAGIGHLR